MLGVLVHDLVGGRLEVLLQRPFNQRDYVLADYVKVLIYRLINDLAQRPVAIKEILQVQGAAADSHSNVELPDKHVCLPVHVPRLHVHDDIRDTTCWIDCVCVCEKVRNAQLVDRRVSSGWEIEDHLLKLPLNFPDPLIGSRRIRPSIL